MIGHFFKIAWRHIGRNKLHAFINVAGLAVGMASVVLIVFYVQDEFKYDRFLKNAGKIFEVNVDAKMEGEEGINGNTPPPVGAALLKSFPEIESYTRIYRPSDVLLRNEEEKQQPRFFTERNLWAVDSNFLQVFSFRIKEGNPLTCLRETHSLVITEKTAEKYFGQHDALGKIILLGDERIPATV